MGAWGTGMDDNDRALDFMGDVMDYMFNKAYYNEDILVIAKLTIDNPNIFTISEEEHYKKIFDTINEELDNLNCWKEECKEDRKQKLKKLKKEIKNRQRKFNEAFSLTNNIK